MTQRVTPKAKYPLSLKTVMEKSQSKFQASSSSTKSATDSVSQAPSKPKPTLQPIIEATRSIKPFVAKTSLIQSQVAKKNQLNATGQSQVSHSNLGSSFNSERARQAMVQRLRTNGETDERVLQALAWVPRHQFMDEGFSNQAYEDAALPIGHQQTISKPSVVARMIALMCRGKSGDIPLRNVLEIGTGCGYQAAVLSLVAQEVYSIERIKPLYEKAKTNLRPLRVPNIRLHYGDGMLGLPKAAPFDGIILAAAGLEVPPSLYDQLAIGGRLIAPLVVGNGQVQQLHLVERVAQKKFNETVLEGVFFVPLKSGIV